MGRLDKPKRFEQKQKTDIKLRRKLLIEKLRKQNAKKREIFSNLNEKLKSPRKKPVSIPKKLTTAPKKPTSTPKKALTRIRAKEKPEKPKYFQLPNGIKARILSQREKNQRGITEARDTLGPKLRLRNKCPGPKQLEKIRKTSEFFDPNNAGTPLVEINEIDLDKTILTCGTPQDPVHYKLKEFLRIDPKDISDAPKGTYFTIDGQYYRKITRLNPAIIRKFGRLHQELEDLVNKFPEFPKKNLLTQGPRFMIDAANQLLRGPKRVSVRLYIDENYRSYGENVCTYVKKETGGSDIKYGSIHTSGNALDLETFILINGKKINGKEAEILLRKAITAEWTKLGGGRGFYTTRRNFHMDSRNGVGQWGPEWE